MTDAIEEHSASGDVILSERPRLVEADDIYAAQHLAPVQVTHDHALVLEAADGECHRQGYDEWQAFWDAQHDDQKCFNEVSQDLPESELGEYLLLQVPDLSHHVEFKNDEHECGAHTPNEH